MAAVAKIAVVEYHIFVGSQQPGCITATLADNPYTHSSLFNKTMVKLIYYLLDSMPCSRKGCVAHRKYEITQCFNVGYFVSTEVKYSSCGKMILDTVFCLIV